MALGYCGSEVLPEPPAADDGVEIWALDNAGNRDVIVQRSLGPHVVGAAPPMPNPHNKVNQLWAFQKRMGRKVPRAERWVYRKFRRFVHKWVSKNFHPLSPDTDLSEEHWLSETKYAEWRKKELRKCCPAKAKLSRRDRRNKSFIKRERYMEYKYPRGINSRSDQAKVFSGPAFHAIEREIFKHPAFVKFVSVKDRPSYIRNRLGAVGPYYVTDYSAFECIFVPKLVKACEMVVYKYFLRHFPEIASGICEFLTGVNECYMSRAACKVQGRRMSGDMCTSLGNGLTNFLVTNFLAELNDSKVTMVAEGDDGLFTVQGPWVPNESDYAMMGAIIKIEQVEVFSEASFCGIFADPDALQAVVDPVKKVLTMAWTCSKRLMGGRKVADGLLKAKALSQAFETPACPVISVWMKAILDRLSGVDSIHEYDGYHEVVSSSDVVFEAIDPRTRALVERRFGLSVHNQHILEDYFRANPLEPIPSELLDFPHDCYDYWNKYVVFH